MLTIVGVGFILCGIYSTYYIIQDTLNTAKHPLDFIGVFFGIIVGIILSLIGIICIMAGKLIK